MHPNEQLREHLTDAELAALRDLLDGQDRSLAGPAAAGATALAGVGTAAADPSTTDSDGDVGLPGDRTDVWADGVDVESVENSGRYHDDVTDLGGVGKIGLETEQVSLSGANNAVEAQLNYPGEPTVTEFNLPSSLQGNGFVYHWKIQGAGSGSLRSRLRCPDIDHWDSGTNDLGGLGSGLHFFTVRSFDGGTTWYAEKLGQV